MHIAKNLRYLRRRAGLSQAALAQRVGLSANILSRYEQGHVTPSAEALERLANILGASPEEVRYVDLGHLSHYRRVGAARQPAAPLVPAAIPGTRQPNEADQ